MGEKGPTYCFKVEWYDTVATLIKTFTLLYHSGSSSVEMHDIKNHKTFLKNTKIEGVKLSDFYLGSSITILSRTLRIVDFGDEFTKRTLLGHSERCMLFIRPEAVFKAGNILEDLEHRGLKIVNLKMISLTSEEVKCLFQDQVNYSQMPNVLNHCANTVMVALELMGKDACLYLRHFVYGPDREETELFSNPELVILSMNQERSAELAKQLFSNPGGPNYQGLPRLYHTTCCVIKPHAVAEGKLGSIWRTIRERGFCVTAARLFRLSKADAAEFLEVYKGVAHEYPEMLDELAAGPCLAMEVGAEDENSTENVYQTFREFVGPVDPEIARFLRPDTLRAKFGVNKIQNAVHCTDLPDDTELEVNYFFRILDK